MTSIRPAFLIAAHSAAGLIREPAVVTAWAQPSALADFSVGGLAAHLAGQVLSTSRGLAAGPPTEETITLTEHYARARWVGADLDADINVAIRGGGEAAAADGPAALAEQLDDAIAYLDRGLVGQAEDTLIRPPAGPWTLRLDDFLVTRLMEIAVHSDDLAHSVGLATPALPAEALDPVFALLTQLAARRHGPTAVLRALSRAERAPATITAF